jgi:hypothetical protein
MICRFQAFKVNSTIKLRSIMVLFTFVCEPVKI